MNKIVYQLDRDSSNSKLKFEQLLELELDASEVATDMFVLDGIIVTRINDDEIRFYLEPLVATDDPVEPL